MNARERLRETWHRRAPRRARVSLGRARAQLRRARVISLRRSRPYSVVYGHDRGHPLDRVYIEDFLAQHADDIRGVVLEMERPVYAQRFGAERCHVVEVMNLKPTEDATIVGDLSVEGSVPEDRFDCIILTQTLQFVPDPRVAVAQLWRALRPGGTMLITVPVLSQIDPVDSDYWRFTPLGIGKVLRSSLPAEAEVTTTGYGNAITGAAFFAGLSAEDVGPHQLRVHDSVFPVLACARVRRTPDGTPGS